jgi:uncharacterized membrane protein YphA (DoxX/SURF4 family)
MAQKQKEAGPRLWPAKLGIASLRIYVGILFLAAAHWKLIVPPGNVKDAIVVFAETEYRGYVRDYPAAVERGAAPAPSVFGIEMRWYPRFLSTVMDGGSAPYVFGGAILVFEGLLGISLVLGVCTRLMGALGGLMMLSFAWARGPGLPYYTLKMPNYLLVVVLFALALTAAGRIWGLDARLRHKLPGWIA